MIEKPEKKKRLRVSTLKSERACVDRDVAASTRWRGMASSSAADLTRYVQAINAGAQRPDHWPLRR